VLAAHTVAHGLHQQRWRPAGGPFFRMVADLLDLAAAGLDLETSHTAVEGLAFSVPTAEVRGILHLSSILRQGGAPEPESDADRLLRHGVWGTLDPDYRCSLLLGSSAESLGRLDLLKLRRGLAALRRPSPSGGVSEERNEPAHHPGLGTVLAAWWRVRRSRSPK